MVLKVMVGSDFHIENHSASRTKFIKFLSEADCLILAGDIAPVIKDYYEDIIIAAQNKYKYVIVTNGNHCFWSATPEQVFNKQKELENKYPGVYFLNKETITIEGVIFAGATTWFPNTPDAWLLRDHLNDFSQIKDFVPWVFEENERCIEFWKNVEADVFITHHQPSYIGVLEKFKESRLNCYFVEPRLGNIIMEKQPKYCIAGHFHNSVNYHIGKTKVISNPYGYETFDSIGINKDFKYDYVIEL